MDLDLPVDAASGAYSLVFSDAGWAVSRLHDSSPASTGGRAEARHQAPCGRVVGDGETRDDRLDAEGPRRRRERLDEADHAAQQTQPEGHVRQRDQRAVSFTGCGNLGLIRACTQTHWRVVPNRVPTSASVSHTLSVIFLLQITKDDS